MWCFGSNSHGQLACGSLNPMTRPVRALAPSQLIRAAAGSRTSFALSNSGVLVGAGSTISGQFGDDIDDECVLIPRSIAGLPGDLDKIIDISTRGSHCLAITSTGNVLGWGRGDGGYSDTVSQKPKLVRFPFYSSSSSLLGNVNHQPIIITSVATGRMHSVGLDSMGRIWTWGISDQGQCGHGTQTTITTPTQIKSSLIFIQIACGSRHTLALTNSGEVWGWGSSSHSQLGQGPKATATELIPIRVFVFPPNNNNTETTSFTDETKQYLIACGYRHSLCATSTGRIWGFGWNDCQQTVPRIDEGIVYVPTELLIFENNQHELLSISGGGRHTLCATYDRIVRETIVWGWGRNACSELGGVADTQPVREIRPILKAIGQRVQPFLAAGWEHSVVVSPSQDAFEIVVSQNQQQQQSHFNRTSNNKLSSLYVTVQQKLFHEVLNWGDLDAAMSQFVNVVVLIKVFNTMDDHGGSSALATTCVSNIILSIWAYRMGGSSTTPIPHGPNTIALFALETQAYRPVYLSSGGDIGKAKSACLFCTVMLGLLELGAGASSARLLRKYVPRAALLSSVAGVALVFICANFFTALLDDGFGLAPLFVFLIGFGSRDRMPMGIPVAFAALVVGIILSEFIFPYVNGSNHSPIVAETLLPQNMELFQKGLLTWHDISNAPFNAVFALMDTSNWWLLISVVIPVFTINLVNNLACVEQARTAGDEYDVTIALRIDALATLFGAIIFGMISPMCFYMGHVGYRAWGASYRYPLINAFLLFLIVIGFTPMVYIVNLSPRTSAVGILVFVGALVTSEAFKVKRHGIAVVLGLVPALAAFHGAFRSSSSSSPSSTTTVTEDKDTFHLIQHGYMLCSLVLSSIVAHILDKRYLDAAAWLAFATVLTMFGFIHERKFDIMFGYFSSFVIVLIWGLWKRQGGEGEGGGDTNNENITTNNNNNNSSLLLKSTSSSIYLSSTPPNINNNNNNIGGQQQQRSTILSRPGRSDSNSNSNVVLSSSMTSSLNNTGYGTLL
jgi:AGZA family xanthine/uracil permease-like MFS transporter